MGVRPAAHALALVDVRWGRQVRVGALVLDESFYGGRVGREVRLFTQQRLVCVVALLPDLWVEDELG